MKRRPKVVTIRLDHAGASSGRLFPAGVVPRAWNVTNKSKRFIRLGFAMLPTEMEAGLYTFEIPAGQSDSKPWPDEDFVSWYIPAGSADEGEIDITILAEDVAPATTAV